LAAQPRISLAAAGEAEITITKRADPRITFYSADSEEDWKEVICPPFLAKELPALFG